MKKKTQQRTAKKPRPAKPSQKEHRRGIDVGPGPLQVSPVMYWYKRGRFENDERAQGAFFLAYQQAMDGMGSSIHEWMGLTEEQLNAWMHSNKLPTKRGQR